ncbi:nucleoside hydrolase [Silvibacterium dinghuense]|nr:nucleoside hydrolase [Silvibacterium dinghuense]GGH11842.1 inosine-uridine preferring nucleoside hydrolase [Silvibacterium dinghuense]
MPRRWLTAILFGFALSGLLTLFAGRTHAAQPPQQLVLLDTDIGDDIDDAFALALIERSPDLRLLGVTTAFGDTHLRARLVRRFLDATGFASVPVAAGVPTTPKTTFTQAAYANSSGTAHISSLSGPDFLLDQIRRHPGQITLLAIGPETNLAAAIDKDPATFRTLKRIVIMGGSVDRGYDGHTHADPEWNILCDIPAAQKVFTSGVPIALMPLDSTILKFPPDQLQELFSHRTPLIGQLHELETEWSKNSPYAGPTLAPTLFDPMTVTYAVRPDLCPTTPLHLVIDDKGFTRRTAGTPNVGACLKSDPGAFFHFYLSRVSR